LNLRHKISFKFFGKRHINLKETLTVQQESRKVATQ